MMKGPNVILLEAAPTSRVNLFRKSKRVGEWQLDASLEEKLDRIQSHVALYSELDPDEVLSTSSVEEWHMSLYDKLII